MIAFTGLLAVLDGEAVVSDEDRLAPGDGAGDLRLAVVGVGVEVTLEGADLDVGEIAHDISLVIVPAHLAVGDDVDARPRSAPG